MSKSTEKKEIVSIPKMNEECVGVRIRGTSQYVANKFSSEAKAMMKAKQEAGSQAKKGGKREAKDFAAQAREHVHWSTEGWPGIPASCFRQAMVSACRLVGFKMTLAKLALHVDGDGIGVDEGEPLIKFAKGEPEYCEHYVRLATGAADIAPRMKWAPGWEAEIKIRYDADVFAKDDIYNLLSRVGKQVGLGAGRPDSKTSTGMGWGLFDIVQEE